MNKKIKGDITIEFNEPQNRVNLQSGESIKNLIGKASRFLKDLKSVAFSNSYLDLNDKPGIATTATAGLMSSNDKDDFDDLIGGVCNPGVVWKQRYSDNSFLGKGCYGNGVYIILRNGNSLAISNDVKQWEIINSPEFTGLYDICYGFTPTGGHMFFVIGTRGKTLKSVDNGRTWSVIKNEDTNVGTAWIRIAFAFDRFFVFTQVTVRETYDGINWITGGVTLPVYPVNISFIASSDTEIVVISDNIFLRKTLTGNWSDITIPWKIAEGHIGGFCYGNGMFVISAESDLAGYFYISKDGGLNWQKISHGYAGLNCYNIAYSKGLFITCSELDLLLAFRNFNDIRPIRVSGNSNNIFVSNTKFVITNMNTQPKGGIFTSPTPLTIQQ